MEENNKKKKLTSGEIALAVILLLLPVFFLQILSFVLLMLIPFFLLALIALAVFAVFVMIGGITLFGIGISKCFVMPMGALAIAGYGLANIGIALFIECFVLWIFTVVIPAAFRKIRGNKEVENEEAS